MNINELEIQGRVAALDAILLSLVKHSPDSHEILGEAMTSLTKLFDLNDEAILSMDSGRVKDKEHTLIANKALRTITLNTVQEFRKELANES